MRPLLLCIAGLLLVTGCASGPLVRDAPDLTAPAEFPHHSTDQVLARMNTVAASDSLVAFSSQAQIKLRSPARDVDLSATIRQREADTLWASARGPFSVEVARALATPDSIEVLDKLHDRLYVGSTAAAARFLPSRLGTRDLFATLLGTLRPPSEESWTLRADDRYYVLTDRDGRYIYTIDPATWRTVRYQGFADGILIDERTFSAFDVIDGRVLPRRIEVRNPLDEVGLTIEHRRLTLNPPALEFPFSPGDAEVRRLE